MKRRKSKLKLFNIIIVIAPVLLYLAILTLQTQISMLNQEYSDNRLQLEVLVESNNDLEMRISENLTRDRVSQFADSNGLVQRVNNVIDVSGVVNNDE